MRLGSPLEPCRNQELWPVHRQARARSPRERAGGTRAKIAPGPNGASAPVRGPSPSRCGRFSAGCCSITSPPRERVPRLLDVEGFASGLHPNRAVERPRRNDGARNQAIHSGANIRNEVRRERCRPELAASGLREFEDPLLLDFCRELQSCHLTPTRAMHGRPRARDVATLRPSRTRDAASRTPARRARPQCHRDPEPAPRAPDALRVGPAPSPVKRPGSRPTMARAPSSAYVALLRVPRPWRLP
jgi:hypothetical protein